MPNRPIATVDPGSVQVAIEVWAKQTAIDGPDLEHTSQLVARQFEVLRNVVVDNHRDDVEIYPSPGMDPIVQALEGLLEGRVGGPLPQKEHDSAVAEGKRRHSAEEPPGYKEKESEKAHLVEGIAGDYLVWVQSMAEAQHRGLDLMLVTGDEKEDWYWRFRDALIGPRPELSKEFWTLTKRRLFLLTPIDFMRRYRESGGDVSESALIEAEQQIPSAETAERVDDESEGATWTPSAVQQLLSTLDAQAPVQAAVIRAAAASGGIVSRDEVFRLGGYGPKRMLRGFTRPVRRFSRLLQETGELDLRAPELLSPRYDHGVQANAFEIPSAVVEILNRSAPVAGVPTP